MTKRRRFLRLLVAGVLARPLAVHAQAKLHRLGVIHAGGEFALDLRTARELGLAIPQLIVLRADEVIQ